MPVDRLEVSSPVVETRTTLGRAFRLLRMPHYAWIVAGVTFATLLMAGGIRGSSGILVVPLEAEFHWSRATIALAVGVNMFFYGLVGPFAAALMERFGVRRTMLGALAAIGLGTIMAPAMSQSWQLVLLWGIVVGAGTGMTANVLAATVATRWFAASRGLVVGLLTSAAAAGQLIFLPLLATITVTFGWRWMAITLAAVAFGLSPIVAMLMRDRPEDLSLSAYGCTEKRGTSNRQTTVDNTVMSVFSALGTGMRSRDFWLLGGTLFICGASTNGLIGTHLIPACIDHGIPEVTGASLLAGMAIFNFMGATGSGWLSDRVDPRMLLVAYYGLRGLSLAYLPFAFDSFYSLSAFAVFYGLDWIATIPASFQLIAARFPKQQTGIIFGWLLAIHQVGGASAAFVAGVLRMDLGTYLEAFILSGVLCVIAAAMVLFLARIPTSSQTLAATSAA